VKCVLALSNSLNMPTSKFQLWWDIQDIIGPATYWPRNIRRNFWTRRLTHWERIITAAFIWISGLNLEQFFWLVRNERILPDSQEVYMFTDIINSCSVTLRRAASIDCGHGMSSIICMNGSTQHWEWESTVTRNLPFMSSTFRFFVSRVLCT